MKLLNLPERINKLVFSSRWLLLPFNFGLILVLFIYSIRFLGETYHFTINAMGMSLEDLKLGGLSLIDSYMIANLFIMIIKGSYQIFIAKFHPVNIEDRPQWLDHVDTGLLKIKLLQSVSAIAAIQLLKDFSNLDHVEWSLVWKRAILELVFLLAAWIMARIWRSIQIQDHEKV